MDQAKSAVGDFLHKSGKHDTTVHEKVAPAVTHETHHHHQHENVTTAIDREVHQDHYHTSVQPIHHSETLPEQHHHNIIPVEHKSFKHGNHDHDTHRLSQEAAKFKDEYVEGEHKKTHSVVPVATGEHIHHHVHEIIQPVVNKETIEPHVVHTTIPVHEVHQNESHHHASTALPAISMADFKKQGGVLTGREERNDGFEGEPRNIVGPTTHHQTTADGSGSEFATGGAVGGSHHHHHGHGTTDTVDGVPQEGALRDSVIQDRSGNGVTKKPLSDNIGVARTSDEPVARDGAAAGTTATGTTATRTGTGNKLTKSPVTGGSDVSDTTRKPSLMDRLNPKKDSDGDGKRGFMR